MCDLVYGMSKAEAQLILLRQVPFFSNERGQIEEAVQRRDEPRKEGSYGAFRLVRKLI